MFEGQFDRKSIAQARENELLRQFRWTELVAKLSATRDFREELARAGQEGEQGGFTAFAEIRRESGQELKSCVNHKGLTHGKTAPLDLRRAASGAVHGDEET